MATAKSAAKNTRYYAAAWGGGKGGDAGTIIIQEEDLDEANRPPRRRGGKMPAGLPPWFRGARHRQGRSGRARMAPAGKADDFASWI